MLEIVEDVLIKKVIEFVLFIVGKRMMDKICEVVVVVSNFKFLIGVRECMREEIMMVEVD